MPKYESLTRRDFLTVAGTGLAAFFLASCNSGEIGRDSEEIRQNLLSNIQELGCQKTLELGTAKLEKLLGNCADHFISQTGIDMSREELVTHTYLYPTTEEFIAGVRKAGVPDYNPDPANMNSGEAVYKSRTAHINLQEIDNDSDTCSNSASYRASLFFLENLYHEWMHLLPIEKYQGKFINNTSEYFLVNGNKEPWIKYRGTQIYSQNANGFYDYNEAVNEFFVQDLLVNVIQADKILRPDLELVLSTGWSYKSAIEVRNIIARTNDYMRSNSLPEISQKAFLTMYQNSDVEQIFELTGQIFTDEALSLLSPVQIGGRDAAKIREDRNFLLGKKLALIINDNDWALYDQMFRYLKPL